MVQQAFPSLNGQAQSWVDLVGAIIIHDGPKLDLEDIKSIKWDTALEVGTQRRVDGSIKAFTKGAATPSGSLEYYADGCVNFIEKLIDVAIAKNCVRGDVGLYGMVSFDIVTMHTPLGTTAMRKVEILGCRLKKDMQEGSEGVEAESNALELIVTQVIRTVNGKRGALL